MQERRTDLSEGDMVLRLAASLWVPYGYEGGKYPKTRKIKRFGKGPENDRPDEIAIKFVGEQDNPI